LIKDSSLARWTSA